MNYRIHSHALSLLALIGATALGQDNNRYEFPTFDDSAFVLDQGSSRNSTSELVRQRFPNGAIAVEREVIELENGDFVNHGSYVQKNEAGNIVVTGNFNKGEREGEWRKQLSSSASTHLLGQQKKAFKEPITSKAEFVDGKLSGDWTCSDAAGRLVFVWGFEDGLRSGLSTWFAPDGKVIRSISYNKNRADGAAHVVVSKNGVPEDVVFSDGKMRQRIQQKYPAIKGKPPVLRSDEWFLVPTPLNLTVNDWENSQITYAEADQNDQVRHGTSTTYFPNGRKEIEGQYSFGKRTGRFAWWYSNGQESTVGAYENDLEQGSWTWWHENGMKKAQGEFVDGARVAQWSLWSENGKLVKRTDAHPQHVAKRQSTTDR